MISHNEPHRSWIIAVSSLPKIKDAAVSFSLINVTSPHTNYVARSVVPLLLLHGLERLKYYVLLIKKLVLYHMYDLTW